MFRLTPGFMTQILLMPVAIGLCLTMSVASVGQTLHLEREWTDNTGGFRITAEFIKVHENNVILYRTDKKIKIAVPFDRLSHKDRQYITDITSATNERPGESNPDQKGPENEDTGSVSQDPLRTPEMVPDHSTQREIVKPATAGSTEMNSILSDQLDRSPPVETRIGDTSPGIGSPPKPDFENTGPVEAQISDSTNTFPRPAPTTNESNSELSKTESTLPANVPPEHLQPSLEMQPVARENRGAPEFPALDHPVVNPVDKETDFVPSATDDLTALPHKQPIETIDPIASDVVPFARIPKDDRHTDKGSSLPSKTMNESSSTKNYSMVSVEAEDGGQAWTTIDDESLAEMFQVSGSLAWKGTAHVTHLLDPVLPNFELVIGVRGTEILDAISNIGFVQIETMVDNRGIEQIPVTIPPSVADPRKGWTTAQRGGANSRIVKGNVQPVLVAVEFPRSDPIPASINLTKGTVRIQLATRYEILTVKNASEARGLVHSQAIRDKGLEIRINRPDSDTIVVEVTGNPGRVLDVNLFGEESVGKNRLTTNRAHYYQFNFGTDIPPNLVLKVRMVAQAREIILPFEFGKMKITAGM